MSPPLHRCLSTAKAAISSSSGKVHPLSDRVSRTEVDIARKGLETSGYDLIFCYVTVGLAQGSSWSDRHHVVLHTLKHGQPLAVASGLQ